MKRFVKHSDVRSVSPNIGWDRKTKQAANTNPELVAAVVKMCFDAGDKAVKVGDNSVETGRPLLRKQRHRRHSSTRWAAT